MKKLISYLTAAAIVLTLGSVVAFADDWSNKTMADMHNGITVFATGPAAFDEGAGYGPVATSEWGSAAGGLSAWEPSKEVYNGVTIFAIGPVPYDELVTLGGRSLEPYEEGSAAGGLRADEARELSNGITVFHRGPIDFD